MQWGYVAVSVEHSATAAVLVLSQRALTPALGKHACLASAMLYNHMRSGRGRVQSQVTVNRLPRARARYFVYFFYFVLQVVLSSRMANVPDHLMPIGVFMLKPKA